MAIITVSRQMGTGAYQIARDVAKRLKYTLVDGAMITGLAARCGLSEEALQRIDEKPPVYISTEDEVRASHLATVELILLESCRQGNVILYGRGGQDLLDGMGNLLRLRFIAPFDERIENFAEREWLDPDLVRSLIRKSDQQREGFIKFYFERDWNDPLGYDLVFNTSWISRSAIVESIMAAARDPRLAEAEAESSRLLEEKILCKRIEVELLRSGAVEYLHFTTRIENGAVVFSGHVHSESERETALSIARRIAGSALIADRLQAVEYRRYRG